MTEAAEQLEPMEVPAGGIGEFVKTDEEIEALEREEADLEFGNDGIAYFSDVAGKMAGYGRFGDDSIAHIETGEIVVPKALIENNPTLKEQIFAELREAGVEDPEQYVVGSKANSINPETGLMEFGFLKNIFKGVGKIFKGIGKVLKKAAGIILPVALSFIPGVGPILAASLGSGIGTLIQGGNLKDAFKSALLGGVTAGVVKGISGPGSFMENVAVKADGRSGFEMLKDMRADKALKKAAEATVETAGETALGEAVKKTGEETLKKTGETAIEKGIEETIKGDFSDIAKGAIGSRDSRLAEIARGRAGVAGDVTGAGVDAVADTAIRSPLKVLGTEGQKFFGPEGKLREIFMPKSFYGKEADISFLRRFGPGAAAATGIMAATGGFKTPEQEDPGLFPRDEFGNPITGASMIRQDPGAYLIADIGDLYLDPETGTYKRKGRQDETLVSEMLRARTPEQGPMMAADGGDVEYPRRFGGIMPEEGVPDEDSVPALLMPGEFVMTVPAVKGMGDGDLTTGISRMYDVMSRLEKRGRQVA